MSKLFVTDEGHWITINGNHVLINKKGEVQSGLGGKFNGRRISKFTGVPSREQLSNAYGENGVKQDRLQVEKRNIENSKDYKKAERELKRIDKMLDKQGDSLQYWQPEKYASLVGLREEYASQLKAMKEGVKRQEKKTDAVERNLRKALKRDKNGFYTNQTAKEKQLSKHVANAGFNNADREERVKRKADAIAEKYNKMAERVRNRKEGDWRYDRFAQQIERRGNQLAENVKENARAGLTWSNRRNDAWHRNNAELDKTERKNRALEKFLDRNKRLKLANAAGANAYMKERGTKVSKATPEMAGGRFVKPAEEAKSAENMAKTYERRYWSSGQRDENLTYAKSARRVANAYKKNEENARNALAKARPKIAERRQAIRKYNEREDEKLAKAMGLGKYRKPYYETDSFKSGQKSGDSNV